MLVLKTVIQKNNLRVTQFSTMQFQILLLLLPHHQMIFWQMCQLQVLGESWLLTPRVGHVLPQLSKTNGLMCLNTVTFLSRTDTISKDWSMATASGCLWFPSPNDQVHPCSRAKWMLPVEWSKAWIHTCRSTKRYLHCNTS